MQKSILFVDDEENILKGLKRMLHRYSKEWFMLFAVGGDEALEIMKQCKIEVLVTDMKMPKMSGVELMKEVKRLYPDVIRIVLSGHSEKEDVIKSVSLAHQYLAKPCPPDKLIDIINNTYILNTILKSQEVKRTISTIDSLPTLPETYYALMDELNNPEFSLKRVGEIISDDIGMSTSILKQVNSSFWGLPNPVSTPEQAVSMLGGDIVKALVLSTHLFDLGKDVDTDLIPIEELEFQSKLTGRYSKLICEKLNLPKEVRDFSFIASILQDVGRLVLASNFPDTYSVVMENAAKNPEWALKYAEYTVMGVTHAEVGAYLLGIWGIHNDVVISVAVHHTPRSVFNKEDKVCRVSYLAGAIAELLIKNDFATVDELDIDNEYLVEFGVKEILPELFEEAVNIFLEVKDV